MSAFTITRIQTGDYERWRPMFDQDRPRAREKAQVQRVLRSIDDPNEVFIYLEYESVEEANEARTRLVSSGVLERFEDKHGPMSSSTLAKVGRLRQGASMTSDADVAKIAVYVASHHGDLQPLPR